MSLTGSYQGSVGTNNAPSVTVTNPTSGDKYTPGDNVVFAANASDSDGSVVKVDFTLDGRLLVSDTTAPYNYSWTAAGDGSHTLVVTATDDKGKSTSKSVSFTVGTSTSTCSADAWSASSVYLGGQRASVNGAVYEARWWTQGDNPSAGANEWYVWFVPAQCQ